MSKVWQLQDAKNRFSEVVDEALHHGPQLVTRHGKEAVVVLSVQEYRKLNRPKIGLVDFFRQSPLRSAKLDLQRNKDLPREVEL